MISIVRNLSHLSPWSFVALGAMLFVVALFYRLRRISFRETVAALGATVLGACFGLAVVALAGCGASLPSVTADFDKLARKVCALDDSWQICRDKCFAHERTTTTTTTPDPDPVPLE